MVSVFIYWHLFPQFKWLCKVGNYSFPLKTQLCKSTDVSPKHAHTHTQIKKQEKTKQNQVRKVYTTITDQHTQCHTQKYRIYIYIYIYYDSKTHRRCAYYYFSCVLWTKEHSNWRTACCEIISTVCTALRAHFEQISWLPL